MVPNKKMLPSQNVSKVLDIKRKNNWLANVTYKTWKELAVHKNTYGVNVMRNDTHDNGGSKKKRNQNFDAFLAPLVSIACRLWSPTITCGRAIRPVLSTRDEEIAVKAFSASAIARERAPFSPPRLSLVVLAPGVVIPFLLLGNPFPVAWRCLATEPACARAAWFGNPGPAQIGRTQPRVDGTSAGNDAQAVDFSRKTKLAPSTTRDSAKTSTSIIYDTQEGR